MNLQPYGDIVLIRDLDTFNKAISKLDINCPCFCDTEGEHLYDHSAFTVLLARDKRIRDRLDKKEIDTTLEDTLRSNSNTSIRLIQLYQPTTKEIYLIDTDYININTIKPVIKQLWTVWVNAPYDLGTLEIVPYKFDDVALLARNAYPSIWRDNQKVSLDVICKYLIPFTTYGNINKKTLQKQRFLKGIELSEEQLKYSAIDVVVMHLLWELPPIQAIRDKPFYKLDMKSLRHSTYFQQNGILVDTNSVEKEKEVVTSKLLELKEFLGDLNSRSYKQVRAKLSELLGHEVFKSDGDYLIELMGKNENTPVYDWAKAIYEDVRAKKKLKTLEGFTFPKLLTRFNPYGTKTGRFSSNGADIPNGINCQQTDRTLSYILEKDTSDTTIIHADYGTAELRTACSIMKDPTMYEYLKKKIDLHKVAATIVDSTLTIDTVTKDKRHAGKAVNFGLIFGMGALRFQKYAFTDYGVELSLEECKHIVNKYRDTYSKVYDFNKMIWSTFETSPVYSPLGRTVLASMGNEAINFSTQAGIGETCKLAIDILLDYDEDSQVYRNDYITMLILQIHDALVMRAPDSRILEVAYFQVKAMLEGWEVLCRYDMLYYKDIPMEVEFEYLGEAVKVYTIEELKEWVRTTVIVKDGKEIPQDMSRLYKEI